MAITKYSHTFLVGSFIGKLGPDSLDKTIWQSGILDNKTYIKDCSTYYKSHIDAMAEAVGQERPDFLKSVKHYYHTIENGNQSFEISGYKYDKESKSLKLEILRNYKLRLQKLHLYFFPLNIILYVIELDDKGSDLNELTMAHFWLMNMHPNISAYSKAKLFIALKPLINFFGLKDISGFINNGNKLKLFQIVQTEECDDFDNLLYEIGTSSSIGVASNNNDRMSPSVSYLNSLLKDNVVDTFKEWKALSLVDSFTILSIKKTFDPWTCINHYFPYIYLRCLFEKTFCFSRNNAYRLNNYDNEYTAKLLTEDIANMEKYYFYNNISHNFLPKMIYDSISHSIGIGDEREEITRQIKERINEDETKRKEQKILDEQQRKEKEDHRQQRITIYLGAFAIFSVVWDLCSMFMKGFTDQDAVLPARLAFAFSIIIIILLIVYQTIYKDKWKKLK